MGPHAVKSRRADPSLAGQDARPLPTRLGSTVRAGGGQQRPFPAPEVSWRRRYASAAVEAGRGDRSGAGPGRLRGAGLRHPPPVDPDAPQLTVVAPQGPLAPLPEAAPDEPAASFDGLDDRTKQATADAAAKGADITTVVLDRSTGQRVTNGNGRGIAIASVVKLFIADDLLLRGAAALARTTGRCSSRCCAPPTTAPPRCSGTGAAAARSSPGSRRRYGLSGTRPPSNGRWFNTISTAADLVRYYDMMLSGAGRPAPGQGRHDRRQPGRSPAPTGDRRNDAGRRVPAAIRHPRGALRRAGRRETGLDVLHRLRLDAPVDRHHRSRTIATSWRSRRTSRPAQPRRRATITQAVKTMFPGGRI